MWEIVAKIIISILFIIIVLVLPRKNSDTTAYSLLFAVIALLIISAVIPDSTSTALSFIPLETLIYLLGMNILILMMDEQRIFHYVAVKMIHMTRSNPRSFFYTICILSAVFSGVMEDVMVTIIFIPLILRATRVLKINSAPYILGVTFAITIGNLLTPFASPANIILSDFFNLSLTFFIMQFGLYFVLLLGISMVALDFLVVRKQDPPTEWQRNILLEIMDANLLIENRNKFIRYMCYFLSILTCLVLISPPYLVVTIGILLILLIERDTLGNYLNKVDWRFLFFLIAIFLMLGNLYVIGILQSLQSVVVIFINTQILLSALIVLVVSALLASFTSRTLTIVLFYTAFQELFTGAILAPPHQTFLIVSLIIGAVIGGNLIPQASSHILKTLDLMRETRETAINYKSMVKGCIRFSLIAIVVGIFYLTGYYLLLIG